MKKYLLFAGNHPEHYQRSYDPGGWFNFIMDSDNLEEVKIEAYKRIAYDEKIQVFFYEWFQIVNRDTKEIITK